MLSVFVLAATLAVASARFQYLADVGPDLEVFKNVEKALDECLGSDFGDKLNEDHGFLVKAFATLVDAGVKHYTAKYNASKQVFVDKYNTTYQYMKENINPEVMTSTFLKHSEVLVATLGVEVADVLCYGDILDRMKFFCKTSGHPRLDLVKQQLCVDKLLTRENMAKLANSYGDILDH